MSWRSHYAEKSAGSTIGARFYDETCEAERNARCLPIIVSAGRAP